MIEDYYKILDLTPKVGAYQIAISYKRLSRKYLKIKSQTTDKNDFIYQINRAFEILKNDDLKKYYDILYKNQLVGNDSSINNPTLKKYVVFINDSKLRADERTERLLNDRTYLLRDNMDIPRKVDHLFRGKLGHQN